MDFVSDETSFSSTIIQTFKVTKPDWQVQLTEVLLLKKKSWNSIRFFFIFLALHKFFPKGKKQRVKGKEERRNKDESINKEGREAWYKLKHEIKKQARRIKLHITGCSHRRYKSDSGTSSWKALWRHSLCLIACRLWSSKTLVFSNSVATDQGSSSSSASASSPSASSSASASSASASSSVSAVGWPRRERGAGDAEQK